MKRHNVPEDLRSCPQWVMWREIERDGKMTKVPFQVDGNPAKSNNRETWSSFEECFDLLNRDKSYAGIGFMFSEEDPYCGIDLDGCRDPDTGVTHDWAKEWLISFTSYAEVSPSGTGWKIFCRGRSKFESGRNKRLPGDPVGGKHPGVEIYDRLRWFAVTAERGSGLNMIADCQRQIDHLCDTYWRPRPALSGVLPVNEVLERARKYVDRVDRSVSGQGGHNAAFKAACVLVHGFGLTPEEAFPIFCEWNQSCQPPWNEREIWHKLNSANNAPGQRLYLRNTKESDWGGVSIPEYKMPKSREKAPEIEMDTLKGAALSYLDALEKGKKMIDLGTPELSYALAGGVELGEVVVIGARPSHGKSAFALQCLHECARQGLPGLIVSEEMSKLAIGKRAILYASGVAHEHWTHDREIVERHLESHFSDRADIFIVENCRSVDVVEAAIERAIQEKGVKVVAVDYAQLLMAKGGSRYEQMCAVSSQLSRVAHHKDILMLVLCQLSREVEKRPQFLPKMGDLADCSQWEKDADVIMFCVWPHRIDHREDPEKFQIFIAKNRNRELLVPAFNCTFEPSRQRFVE